MKTGIRYQNMDRSKQRKKEHIQTTWKLTCGGFIISIETNCDTTRRTGKTRYAAVSYQPSGGCPSCKIGNAGYMLFIDFIHAVITWSIRFQ